MAVDPSSSTSVATNPSDDPGPTAHNTSQGLTRAQLEAAMRVIDARSMSRPMRSPAEVATPALS
jgi:hypothetical protein